ncbi:MAG: hypothetical protein ACRCV9_04085, partial [Burkholderiaceae bacterium]
MNAAAPLLNIEAIELQKGMHKTASQGMCALELCSMLAGEPFSDRPQCVCPTLAAFVRVWNDRASNIQRQEIKRHLRPLLNTNMGLALSRQRAFMAADWAARTVLPMLLDLKPDFAEHAATLRALAQITDEPTARAAKDAIDQARAAAAAAYAAYAAAYAAAAAYAYSAYAAAYADAAADAAAYAAAYAAAGGGGWVEVY